MNKGEMTLEMIVKAILVFAVIFFGIYLIIKIKDIGEFAVKIFGG